jgi:signal transduction histidine kinase
VIRVSVDDNGKGFDPETVLKGNSLGLKLIRERTEMLGGTFTTDSAVGKGARISFSIPIRS